jgi:RNA polymerase sigma-70 factor (ECF subfamily)
MSDEVATSWSQTVEGVYRSQSRELWALFYAQCNDADLAYDALQEAFARLQSYTGPQLRDMRAWLIRVGRNWLKDVARHKRVAANSVDFLDETAGKPANPQTILAQKEMQEQVRAALDRLRTDDREVLVLRYALGWPSNRIAEILELSTTAVDMRLSRARRRLAEILEQAGVDYDPSGEW